MPELCHGGQVPVDRVGGHVRPVHPPANVRPPAVWGPSGRGKCPVERDVVRGIVRPRNLNERLLGTPPEIQVKPDRADDDRRDEHDRGRDLEPPPDMAAPGAAVRGAGVTGDEGAPAFRTARLDKPAQRVPAAAAVRPV